MLLDMPRVDSKRSGLQCRTPAARSVAVRWGRYPGMPRRRQTEADRLTAAAARDRRQRFDLAGLRQREGNDLSRRLASESITCCRSAATLSE